MGGAGIRLPSSLFMKIHLFVLRSKFVVHINEGHAAPDMWRAIAGHNALFFPSRKPV